MLLLLLGELLRLVLLGDLLPLLLGLLGSVALGLLEGVLTDGGVSLSVEVLKTLSLDVVVDVLLELTAETLLIVVGEGLHVLSNVAAEDVVSEGVGIELLGLHVVTGESLLGVGNKDTTVRGALHGTEDTGTSGGSLQTNIEEDLEGATLAIIGLGGLSELELTVSLLDTSEILVEAELLEGTAGNEETGSVSGGPVGETVLDTVGLELVRVGRDEDLVARDLRGHDLADDVLVGEADDQAVLGSIVLVLGLGDEALSGVVIGLALLTALVLGLVAAMRLSAFSQGGGKPSVNSPVVRAVLHQLVENLSQNPRVSNLRFRCSSPSEATCGDSFRAIGISAVKEKTPREFSGEDIPLR